MANTRPQSPSYGRVEDDPTLDGTAGSLAFRGFQWRPNRRILRGLPSTFGLPFRIWYGDGFRAIHPVPPLDGFLDRAAAGGLALLIAREKPPQATRQSYRLMSQLFRWSWSDRRVYARKIERLEDLQLTRSERRAMSLQSVLPEDLAIERNGREVPMTPETLIELGKEFSSELGLTTEAISCLMDFGLFASAMRSEHKLATLKVGDASQIVRFALFGTDQGEVVKSADIVAQIETQLIEVFHRHLDDSPEQFRNWLTDFSTIVRTISKRKGMESITPDQVRYVLMDLLWRSHTYASQCVALQMEAVVAAVRPTLTPGERAEVKLRYWRQPWLGGVSPIVLHERQELVLPVLSLLAGDPDLGDRPWRACLQAMIWRNQIVMNRRAADRSRRHGGSREHEMAEAFWDGRHGDQLLDGRWIAPSDQHNGA